MDKIIELFKSIDLEPDTCKPLDYYDTGEIANYAVSFNGLTAIIWVCADGSLANTRTPKALQRLIDEYILHGKTKGQDTVAPREKTE